MNNPAPLVAAALLSSCALASSCVDDTFLTEARARRPDPFPAVGRLDPSTARAPTGDVCTLVVRRNGLDVDRRVDWIDTIVYDRRGQLLGQILLPDAPVFGAGLATAILRDDQGRAVLERWYEMGTAECHLGCAADADPARCQLQCADLPEDGATVTTTAWTFDDQDRLTRYLVDWNGDGVLDERVEAGFEGDRATIVSYHGPYRDFVDVEDGVVVAFASEAEPASSFERTFSANRRHATAHHHDGTTSIDRFDDHGRLLSRTVGADSTTWRWDEQGRLLSLDSLAAGVVTSREQHEYLDDGGEAVSLFSLQELGEPLVRIMRSVHPLALKAMMVATHQEVTLEDGTLRSREPAVVTSTCPDVPFDPGSVPRYRDNAGFRDVPGFLSGDIMQLSGSL